MITDLFYYSYYVPNRINNYSKSDKTSPIKKVDKAAKVYGTQTRKSESADSSFFLNKAFKNKVFKYVNSLSRGINGIKNISNYITDRLDSEDLTYDELNERVSMALESFVGRFNDFRNLSEDNKEHAVFIEDYANRLRNRVVDNAQNLERAGVTVNDSGELYFDKNNYRGIPVSELDGVVSGLKGTFKEIYKDTFDIMSVPMSEHMNFKDLDYYYNYMYSPTDPNTFRIIETGMLVDIAV